MTSEWSVPGWAAVTTVGILVVLLVLAVVLALRGRSVARRRVADAEQANTELRARLDGVERGLDKLDRRGLDRRDPEFVITSLGSMPDTAPEAPVPALPARAFADAVLRDTVVNAAAFVHGVRRALSPEVRNRIRFEMRREVKRSRKERKVEVREALREYRARHRAEPDDSVMPEGDVA